MTTAITQIYLLMEEQNPVGAYLDKALADADCWTCNEAQYQKEDGDIADGVVAALEDDLEGELEVFLRGGGSVLHEHPLRRDAVRGEPVEHALRLRHILSRPLPAADDGDAIER